MDSIKLLIEEIVKQELDELMVKLPQAESENICLMMTGGRTAPRFILFLGDPLSDYIKAKMSGEKVDPDSYKQVVVGMIRMVQSHNCGFYQVSMSSARQGYGPLLYQIAASAIHPAWIASDRTSASSDAQRLWNNTMTLGKDDYEMEPISSKECQYQGKDLKTTALNYRFRIKNKLSPNKLIQNAKITFEELSEWGANPSYTLEQLNSLAELMFGATVEDS
jgi:hypothetical protein